MHDRDVRNAIQSALEATGAFDGVWIWGLPDNRGSGASQLAAAAIEPQSSSQNDLWDGGPETSLVVTSTVVITLLFRCEDPQLRDEGVELLFDTAANALNGQSFAELTARRTRQVHVVDVGKAQSARETDFGNIQLSIHRRELVRV